MGGRRRFPKVFQNGLSFVVMSCDVVGRGREGLIVILSVE